jgi:hypothetical protein
MNRVRLRNTFKKLRNIEFDRSDDANRMIAPQEMLDFLAMVAGIKPVFLMGRGFDDPAWIKGVSALAREMSLHVVCGSEWEARHDACPDLPQWYIDFMEGRAIPREVFYIAKTRGLKEEVSACCSTRTITIEQEARLLGYPVCCVRDHYRRSERMDHGFYLMLARGSKGDIDEMKRIVRKDVGMMPETPDEIAAIKDAEHMVPAPFTSFNMCNQCVVNPRSPAREISGRFERLAQDIDSSLANEIAVSQWRG